MTATNAGPPLVSVIIPTVAREELLLQCVRSVRDQAYLNYEILIIDQDPRQTLPELLRRNFGADPRLRYYYAHRAGLNEARNIGVKEARGRIVAFLDDDAVAEPEWMEAVARSFSQTPTPALVAGKIVPLWMKEPPPWYPEERKFLLGLYDIGNEPRPLPDGDQPIGANMAGLRNVIVALGGFDANLDFNNFRKTRKMISGGDTTLALRARRAGYAIYYEPGAAVRHIVSAAKLTRRYFLTRHFWEGVTNTEELHRLGELIPNRKAITSFHLKRLCLSAARFVFPNYDRTYSSSRPVVRMLALSRIAHSAGICYGVLTTRSLAPTEKL